ncbi:MAG: permease prefix domain 1-containing protein [Armatimonadetes bacterium]|nr:permease prefix domain 1-containing protein [Armatimonadota bacterium]
MNIEEYLQEMCTALNVDPLRRDEIRLEVHTHLQARAEALHKSGMTPERAEEHATREAGSPEALAKSMDGTPSVFTRALTPSLKRVGGFLVLYGFINLLLLRFGRFSFSEYFWDDPDVYHIFFPLVQFTYDMLPNLLFWTLLPLLQIGSGVALILNRPRSRIPAVLWMLGNMFNLGVGNAISIPRLDPLLMVCLRLASLWACLGLLSGIVLLLWILREERVNGPSPILYTLQTSPNFYERDHGI